MTCCRAFRESVVGVGHNASFEEDNFCMIGLCQPVPVVYVIWLIIVNMI